MTKQAKAIMTEEKTQKFTVEFSTDAVQTMDSIKDKLGKRSRADILRLALLMLKFLLDEKDKGNSIAIISKGEGGAEVTKHLALFV